MTLSLDTATVYVVTHWESSPPRPCVATPWILCTDPVSIVMYCAVSSVPASQVVSSCIATEIAARDPSFAPQNEEKVASGGEKVSRP